jgi:two-component system nitrogen regulation sensor histidine kinase GlnL
MNPAAEALFEISARQVLGHHLERLLPDATTFADSLRETIASNHPFTARNLPMVLPHTRRVIVDCTVTPVTEPEEGLVVELSRVDRRLRLTEEERMLGQHAANRAVLRGIAHEIKNPLGGLRGAAQLLERELGSRNELKEYTRIIIHEADRLRNLVDRMMGSYQPLQRQHLNVHEILEHVAKLVSVEFPPGVMIARDYDPSVPEIVGDPEQLTQAFLNLVRNAAQAVGEKGSICLRSRVERKFTIGKTHHRLVVRVDVADNGPGISEELVERIFFPMVSGRAGGSGLGLSIAQDIVQNHGGLIACESQPNQTVFSIYLPGANGDDNGH